MDTGLTKEHAQDIVEQMNAESESEVPFWDRKWLRYSVLFAVIGALIFASKYLSCTNTGF